MDIKDVSTSRSCDSVLERPRSSLQRTFVVLLLVVLFTLFAMGKVIADTSLIYLGSSDAAKEINEPAMIHAMPGVNYENFSITLGDQARIESISASIAQRARFTLPDRGYDYEFNTRTGRVDISANGSVILSLPVNAQGQTTEVCLGSTPPVCSNIEVSSDLIIVEGSKPGGTDADQPRMRFNVTGGVSALVTDSVATMQPAPRVNELPVLYFSAEEGLAPSARMRNMQSGAMGEEIEPGSVSLFIVEPNGRLRPGLISDVDISVLYTLLSTRTEVDAGGYASIHPEYLFVALDPGYDPQTGELIGGRGNADTRALIASENCALFKVSMQDNEYSCVDEGYLPIPLTDGFRQAIGDGLRKPLQLDSHGNLYYLAREFQLTQPDMLTSDATLPGIQLRRYSRAGELLHLSMDRDQIDHFSVLDDGSIAYTVKNENTLKLAFPVSEGGDEIRMSTRTLTPRGEQGSVFYTVDQTSTVLFGASGSDRRPGVNFVQRVPDSDAINRKQLNTDLYSGADESSAPKIILLGDDYYVYGLFEQAGSNKLQLSQILPYREDPLFVFDDARALLDTNKLQIAKGHMYYVEEVDRNGVFSDVIKIRRLADGREYRLLDGQNERYRIFNWRLSGDTLTFAAMDETDSTVVLGTIDTLSLRRTGRPHVVLQPLASAMGADRNIRDIEILLPQIPGNDYGGNPRVLDVYTHPDNLYSVSIEFTKHMDIDTLNEHLRVYELPSGGARQFSTSDSEGAPIGAPVGDMRILLHRMLHLILDREPENSDATVPLQAATDYRVHFPRFEVWDRYGWEVNEGLDHPFRTAGPTEYTVTAEASEGGIIDPSGDQDNVTAGQQLDFTVTSDPGHQIDGVVGCDGELTGNAYLTAPITESCRVVASFSRVDTPHLVTVTVLNDGDGGYATPQSVLVNHNETTSISLTPSLSYFIYSAEGCGGDLSANSYTTAPITQDCEVQVEFKREPIVIRSCDSWIASRSGGYGVTVDNWDISNIAAGAIFDIKYNAYGIPDRFIVEYPESETVLNTGWRGNSSYEGNPSYPEGIEGPGRGEVDGIFVRGAVADSFKVTVEGPRNGTIWDYEIRCRVPANGNQD